MVVDVDDGTIFNASCSFASSSTLWNGSSCMTSGEEVGVEESLLSRCDVMKDTLS